MISINARAVATMLGVSDPEAVELIAAFLIKLGNATDRAGFLKESLRRAMVDPDKKRIR